MNTSHQSSATISAIAASETSKHKPNNRKVLKKLPIQQSPAQRSTPVRRRKRTAGKRTVKSCTACRAAHVRCVADRYGVPCERCAKKSWLDCTLMQTQPEQPPIKTASTDTDGIDPSSSQARVLRQIASDAWALMTEGM
ncbi:hypothetical protein HD806DRAFT_527852 [Xylariaceae sp. AK1471]|nr:hypothetical protein HD806DRAFT_527852 [Xylariaceae sp. AK1471]